MVFTGYLLASLSRFGGSFVAVMRSRRSSGMAALDPVLYGAAGLATFVVLLAVLRFFAAVLGRFREADPQGGHAKGSIEQFASDAAEAQISVRVARESYELLQQYYPDRMSIDLDHDLREDLKLTDEDIFQLHTGLLSRTERREMRGLAAANIETVHDLVEYVEKAPTQHLGGVAVHVRPTEVSSVERAAGSSGLSLRDQASGQSRRASDYSGPRRRASDNKVKRAYSGPHRRVTDA